MSMWVMSDYAPKEILAPIEWYHPKKDKTYKPNINDRVWECADRVIPMTQGTIYKCPRGDIYKLNGKNWIVIQFSGDWYQKIYK